VTLYRRVAAGVLVLCALVGSAAVRGILRASETRTVEVTAEVHGVGRTPEEARREALLRARDKAVAEVAGIRIAAQQLRLKSEHADAVRDAFSYLVHTSTHGRIVREEVSYRTALLDDIPVYRATLRAEVVLEEGARDPGFALELMTRPESHTYRADEPITLQLIATRNCYVTVLDIDPDGEIGLLFPNEYDGDNFLAAEQVLILPRASSGFEIRASRDGERRGGYEQILAVATLDRVPFLLEDDVEDEIVPDIEREDAVTALNRWLLRIPVNRRTEALWAYEVVP
jgi:hypothetical protein